MSTDYPDSLKSGCGNCKDLEPLPFVFTYAFQPIVDIRQQRVYSHEALVRGVNGEGAMSILSQVTDDNRYLFDQQCRIKAVSLAAELEMDSYLNINFLPNAVYRPELCIRTTIEAAEKYGFPLEKIIFEVTEGEQVKDHKHLANIINHYKSRGIGTAIDDFGAGYSGLNMLAEYQPDILKIDMALVRDIHLNTAKQAIVKGICVVAKDLNITIIAEGVEIKEELEVLMKNDISLYQGYLFAKPGFECLPDIDFSML